MEIVFSNRYFIFIDKPSAVLTIPARFADKDTRPVLGLQLQERLQRKIYPVHRLDYEVSGLVMFALDAQSHKVANEIFENRKVTKTYQALSESTPEQQFSEGQKMEWSCKILKGKKRSFESPHGKPSLTEAQWISVIEHPIWGKGGAWVLAPKTGRSHQLRFEMYRHGFPILGDSLYGSKVKGRQEHSIALRAVRLEFQEQDFVKKFELPGSLCVKDPLF